MNSVCSLTYELKRNVLYYSIFAGSDHNWIQAHHGGSGDQHGTSCHGNCKHPGRHEGTTHSMSTDWLCRLHSIYNVLSKEHR